MPRSLAFLLASAAVLAACKTAPYTHRRQIDFVPEGEEMKLGLTSYQQALSNAKLSTDAQAVAMVRRVGERLAKAADKPDYKWEFNLIDDPPSAPEHLTQGLMAWKLQPKPAFYAYEHAP